MKTDDKPDTICGWTIDEALDRVRDNTGKTPWSVVRIWRLLSMCSRGASDAQIAAAIGFPEHAIIRAAIRLSLPRMRQWCAEHDGMAQALEQRGLSAEEIAKKLFRHPRDVRERLAVLRHLRSRHLSEVAA